MKKLIEQGEKITVEGNRPLLLNDSEKIWIVEKGRIEVFSVKLKSGKPSGHRNHLLTANPGDTLWGISPERHKKDIVLLATGLYGSTLVELSLSQIEQSNKLGGNEAELVPLIDSWVRNAVNGIANKILPKRYVQLEESKSFPLKKGEQALCKNGVLWIRQLEGRTVFRGQDENIFSIDTNFFPVTGYGCIEVEEETVIEIKSTKSLLSQDVFGEIDKFSAKLIDIIFDYETSSERRESSLMGERIKLDDQVLKASLQGLSEVMRPWKEEEQWAVKVEDSLLSACRAVGTAAKIQIKPPPGDHVDLGTIADASRMRTRQVVIKDRWWRSDNGPLLGFLEDGNKPVALLPKSKKQYELYDPASHKRVLIESNIAHTIKPLAYSFYRPFPAKPIGVFDLLRFGYKSAWKSDFWGMLIIGLLGGLLGIVVPVATGFIFNNIIPQAERQQLLQIGLFLLVSACATFLFQIARATAMLRFETSMNVSIQAAVWDRLLSLPVPFFRKYTTGDLATRAGGINVIRQIFSSTVMNSIFTGIFSLFNFILLFFYSRYLAWRASLLVLLSLLVTSICGWLLLRHQKEIAEIGGKLNGLILQMIFAISKFRISGSEKRAYYLWSREFSAKRKSQFKAESLLNVFATWNAIFPIGASMLLFYLIVKSAEVGLSIGNFLAFNAAFTNFTGSLLSLSTTLIGAVAVVPIYNRLRPILEALPEHDETKNDPGELKGEIEIGHVNFRYDPEGPVILDDIYVNIGQGEFVALVGPSGSGKSTLLRLLLGFEMPESGAIYFDGQDLSTLDMRAVRNQIGVVLQNGRLMTGDIYSNIIGASTQLTVQDAWEAAEMAGIADDIKEMPMGMYTHISEGGMTLSGGQRQRLLIARAIVNKPRIIFFDEATSSLDNRTQEIVSRSLEGLNTTRVVIAHRLSTIVNADRIVVMSNGKIVQEGTYEQLAKETGIFAELARRQLA